MCKVVFGFPKSQPLRHSWRRQYSRGKLFKSCSSEITPCRGDAPVNHLGVVWTAKCQSQGKVLFACLNIVLDFRVLPRWPLSKDGAAEANLAAALAYCALEIRAHAHAQFQIFSF